MTIQLSDELRDSGMPKQDVELRTFADGDALMSEITSFIAHVQQRTKPAVSGAEGRRALAVALQVMDQIKEHKSLTSFRIFFTQKSHEP